jgi:micrococcal nuclease
MSNIPLFHYRAKVIRVIDGDTIDVELDLGFDISLKERIRFYGVNTPESRTKDLEEKARGIAAKNFVGRWLLEECGHRCIIETRLDKKGKFGRILGRVLDEEGNCLNDLLLAEGHAIEYFGGKRSKKVETE